MPQSADKAREALDPIIEDELRQARDRAASLEQRAMAVITTSGVLVSLVFGFGTLIKGKQFAGLSNAPRVLLLLALISLVATAVIALFTIRPRNYPVESGWKKVLGVCAGSLHPAKHGNQLRNYA